MNEDRLLRYLELLDLDDLAALEDHLQTLLEDETNLDWNPADTEGDISLGTYGSLELAASCSEFQRRFFHWWGSRVIRQQTRHVDALTGLHTRSDWERRLKKARSYDRWTVVLGDIDRFKRFNDEHGHDMGDRVLAGVGEAARNHFSDRDRLVRYGGEELLFVLAPDSEAETRAEQFRQCLEETYLFDDQPEPVTLSLGLARKRQEESMDACVKRADRALYVSKSRGRNRLTAYAPYMEHLRSLSIWGMYRYVWDPEVRFCLRETGRDFLVMNKRTAVYYRWKDDEVDRLSASDALEAPVRTIVPKGEAFYLLDAEGTLWRWTISRTPDRVTSPSDPALAWASGGRHGFWAVGVNNQLYRVTEGGLERHASLPEQWEYLTGDRDVFLVRGGEVVRWRDGESREVAGLPAEPAQVVVNGDRLLLSGKEGGLYALSLRVGRWHRYRLPRLNGKPVYCREFSARGDRILMRDGQGRLLLTDLREKAVPQSMNLAVSEDDP